MADTRFFKKAGPFTLKQLADLSECTLKEGTNPDQIVTDVAGLKDASKDDLSWAFIKKVREDLKVSKAGAVITSEAYLDNVPAGMGVLVSKDPHRSYGLAAQAFYPRTFEAIISDKAVIDETAQIGPGSRVEAGAVIGKNVKIGKGAFIGANAVIGDGVEMGDGCTIGATATVSHSIIGHGVNIYPGARIGQDGFGFAMGMKGPTKVPQLGRVIIGNGVEIGSNTTVDRGAMGDTEIGDGTWIDNLVQIAHNVKLGKCCIMVSQVGIAGSCTLGDFVVCGGQVGLAGHLNIGTGAQIGAQSGLMKDVEPGAHLMGAPAMPSMDFMRLQVMLQKMINGPKKGE